MKMLSKRWLLIVVLLALLGGACRFDFLNPPPSPGTETETETPTDQPVATTPTREPTPAVSLPMPPPKLLVRDPEAGERPALDTPIKLTFDQPMDAESVRASFAISPSVPGELRWEEPRTLIFDPQEALERGAHYRVTVDESARNVEGAALPEPITFDFQTLGYVEVGEVQPAPDTTGVDPDTVVTVVFNRPIVPLTSLAQQSDLPQPLTFDPPLAGEGEWLNTAIYRFHPDEGLAPATRYTARISAGLEDTQGSVLEEDYVWRFTTIGPGVIDFSPRRNAEHVAPGDVISVTFNQPMAHAATEGAFRFRVGDSKLAGDFRWSGGESPWDSETMIFTPAEPLARDTRYHVSIYATARARNSEVQLQERIAWSFNTIKKPGVLAAFPPDGATDVSPYEDVRLTFASPMQREGFMEYLQIIPAPTKVYTYWSNANTELRLSFQMEPATEYQIALESGAPDVEGAPLSAPLRLRFTTGDLPPYAQLNTGRDLGTFNAYTETVIYAGYRNVSRLDVRLYRLDPETLMQMHSYGSYRRERAAMRQEDLVREWSVAVAPPANVEHLRALEMVDETGEQLPPGIYYLEMSAPEVLAWDRDAEPDTYIFIRSRLNLMLKQTHTETLIWATDLATGAPVADAPVRIYTSTITATIEGATDADGRYIGALQADDLWSDTFAFSGEPGQEDFSVAYSAWDQGLDPWQFDLNAEFYRQEYRAHIYTDRPIYRPGQTVYFKGIIRADDDARYTIPDAMQAITLTVTDPQGKELYNEQLILNEMGSFFDEVTLDAEAALGSYYIQMAAAEQDFYASADFQVAEYRKPEFEVTVQTDRDAYINGDTIQVAVEATYYFGGPVANAELDWNVLSSDFYFDYQCPTGKTCPRYSWYDFEWEGYGADNYGGYGELIAQGDARTDEDGRAVFEVPADIAEKLASQRFTVEANVTDLDGRYVSNRTTAVVHKGEYYIGVGARDRIAEAGETKSVDLLTVDWGSEPVADQSLQVVFMEHRWYSVREEAEDGFTYWTWVTEDVPVYTTTATTDDDGKAAVAFTPEKSGSYKVLATGEDTEGNEIRSSTYLWVWGGGGARWRQESNNRIDLIPDKDDYEVGDVAEILIPSPYTGAVRALITIERGHFFSSEVRTLESNTEVIRVPIEAAHIPNIFVSVVIVQGSDQAPDTMASFKMGLVKLPISIEQKQLHITLTPDRALEAGAYYRPRETAVYDVQVTDHAGDPVAAELSLRLADLAVLALSEDRGPTLLERFWSERGISVRTSMPLAVAMEPYNRELAPRAKGGGGGAGEAFIRTEFADTAFWEPVVETGADGRARVEVKLPDNLTTWRMQARGITAQTAVDRAEVDIRSTLDVLVRPVLPRFFVVGDQADIAAIVHNNTTRTLATEVTLTAEGVDVDGGMQQQIELAPGEETRVVWPITVQAVDEVKITMEANAEADGASYYDGREDTLPVYHYTTPEVMATAGQLSEPEIRQELIQLPPEFDRSQGGLTIQVDGSLTAATQDALDYLEHYPYECVEQTVSRFLPNVLTYQALDEMGLARPEMEANLTEQVGAALQRLYAQQHYDGGWGWWVNDDSNPYLTAYALHGMLEAHRAGFTVETDVIHKAADYLRTTLPAANEEIPTWRANRLAYQLYVLGEYVRLVDGAKMEGELGRAITLFEVRHKLSRYGQATLAVALGLLDPEEETRIDTLLADLVGDAVMSATGTHWQESAPDYWNMNTDVRTTAIVLWAMARHRPESDLLPNVVRWLMETRRGDDPQWRYWESTYTTSWALTGLIAYMRASGELQGDFPYTVALNGEILLEARVDETTMDESRQLQINIADLLVEHGNRLVIERLPPDGDDAGEGRLYYTAHLRYFLPAAQVEAEDRGIIVARQYERVDNEEGNDGDHPEASSLSGASVGDTIRVKLTVIAPDDLYYVVVEDPLPAGCEAVDMSLETTSVVGERPSMHSVSAEEEDYWYRRYGWGWWWFSHSELRDEKVTLFASYLPRGTYEYTYLMRASVPGAYNVIPTSAYAMYFPEIWGRSDGLQFTVEE